MVITTTAALFNNHLVATNIVNYIVLLPAHTVIATTVVDNHMHYLEVLILINNPKIIVTNTLHTLIIMILVTLIFTKLLYLNIFKK